MPVVAVAAVPMFGLRVSSEQTTRWTRSSTANPISSETAKQCPIIPSEERLKLALTASNQDRVPSSLHSSVRVMIHSVINLAMRLLHNYCFRIIVLLLVCTTVFLPTLLSFRVDPAILQLRNSNYYIPLQFAYACSLASTFPLFMDISLDYFSFPNAAFLNQRILSTLVLAISNGIILIYFNSSTIEMIMLTSFMWSYLIEFTVILSTIHALSDLPSSLALDFSRLLSFLLLYVFFFASVLSETSEYGGRVLETVAIVSFVLFTFVHFLKTYLLFRGHYLSYTHSNLSFTEWYSNVDDKQKFLQFRLVGFAIQIIVLYLVFFAVGSPTNDGNGLFHADDLFHLIIVRAFFFMFEYFVSARIFRGKLIRSNQDLAFKTQLIKYFSHEMRSPIMVMTVGLDLIAGSMTSMKNKNISPQIGAIEDNLADVRSSCQQSLEILDGMLLYERIENGTVVPDLSAVEPLKGIRELLKVYESAAKSMQLSIFLQYCQDEFDRNKRKIIIDASKLRHVFSAILSSVFKKVGTRSVVRSSQSQENVLLTMPTVGIQGDFDAMNTNSILECVANLQTLRSQRLSSNDMCFKAFIDVDLDAMQSVLKSRLHKQSQGGRDSFGNAFLPSWLHIEMKDSYGDISDEDISEMNSHTLDFSRKGYLFSCFTFFVIKYALQSRRRPRDGLPAVDSEENHAYASGIFDDLEGGH